MTDTARHEDSSPPRDAGKRPWITNLVLLGLVLALGVWVLLGEPETEARGTVPPQGKVFPRFVATDVVRIDVVRGDETLVFTRATKGADSKDVNLSTRNWVLESPVADLADDGNVNRLLNGVEHMRVGASGRILEDELASYSFGDVVATITLKRSQRPTLTFSIGAERPGGVIPVKLSDGNIVQVKSQFLGYVNRDLDQFRDRQLLAVKKENVTGVVIEQREAQGPGDVVRTTALIMQEGRWRLGSPDGEVVAGELVEALVERIDYTKAEGVVADAPSEADLETFGLTPPQARVTLSWPGDEAVIELGKEIDGSPQERYGRIPSKPAVVYRVSMTPFYEGLARPPKDYLHPGLFPLQGGESTIDGIRATFDDAPSLDVETIPDENMSDWRFANTDPMQLAKNEACVALARALLELRVRKRLGRDVDTAAVGLDQSELTISLRQGEAVHTVSVGAPVPGEPGVHTVGRKEPDGSLTYYYTVDLGELPFRLRDAVLELRHPTLFRASSWNVTRFALVDETGKETFAAERPPPGGNVIPKWKVVDEPTPTDDEQVKTFLKQFDDVQVEKWLTLDSPQGRRDYGLAPHPRKLVFRIETLGEGGKLVPSTRTLLIGERNGERVHAMAEDGSAIGLIDAGFLDRLARGFSQGTPVLEMAWMDIEGVTISKDGEQIASFKKPGINWVRDRLQIVEPIPFRDSVLKPFQRVVLASTEVATDARLEETGLKTPEWTLTFEVKARSGKVVKQTLHIGNGSGVGKRVRWARANNSDTIGTLYDEPVRTLEEYLSMNPPPRPPRDPKKPDHDDHDDHDH